MKRWLRRFGRWFLRGSGLESLCAEPCPPVENRDVASFTSCSTTLPGIVREFEQGRNDFDLFFEQFETVTEAGISFAQWRPDGQGLWAGYRMLTPPTMVRFPYGSLDIGLGVPCEHVYARGLVEFDGRLWTCNVCRNCQHIAPPGRDDDW